MIAAAADAGADYVKMQTIFADDLTDRPRFEEGETGEDGEPKVIKRPYASERERLSALELSEEDHRFFIGECIRHHVTPFTTVFSRNRVPFVAALPWPEKIVKVASYDCGSLPLIGELCDRFDHLVISTGASTDEEVEQTAAFLQERQKTFTFLHCVTSYPNALDQCHLRRMAWLRELGGNVGWSDHTAADTDGVKASMVAIAEGAEWIERHFTILDRSETKDGKVSITPDQLRELSAFGRLSRDEQRRIARSLPEYETIMGVAQREMTATERRNRDYYRGRFASNIGGEWVYNWEEKPVFPAS